MHVALRFEQQREAEVAGGVRRIQFQRAFVGSAARRYVVIGQDVREVDERTRFGRMMLRCVLIKNTRFGAPVFEVEHRAEIHQRAEVRLVACEHAFVGTACARQTAEFFEQARARKQQIDRFGVIRESRFDLRERVFGDVSGAHDADRERCRFWCGHRLRRRRHGPALMRQRPGVEDRAVEAGRTRGEQKRDHVRTILGRADAPRGRGRGTVAVHVAADASQRHARKGRRPRYDGVHANAVGCVIVGEGGGQCKHSAFAGRVGEHVRFSQPPPEPTLAIAPRRRAIMCGSTALEAR